MVSSNSATASATKTHKIDKNFLKRVLLKIPIHAAKRSFKPLLVLVVLLMCFGLYLLLHRSSSSTPSESIPFLRDIGSSKYHQKLKKILKPTTNEENNQKDVISSNKNMADVKNPIEEDKLVSISNDFALFAIFMINFLFALDHKLSKIL